MRYPYWGPLVSIYVKMREQCARRKGLALAIVVVSGDAGYVLDEARIERLHEITSRHGTRDVILRGQTAFFQSDCHRHMTRFPEAGAADFFPPELLH